MATIEKRELSGGATSYRARVRIKGHPQEIATFERLTDARRWVQQTEAAIREGRYFKTSQARKFTLSDAIKRYREEILSHKKASNKNVTNYLDYWDQELGAYALADITPALIVSARNKFVGSKSRYGRTRGPTTANRYVSALSHVFTIAINDWEWLEIHPVRKISKLKQPRGRVRFLSDDERKKLLKACKSSENPHLYKIVVMALSTGARKMEIVGLKWKDIDLERGTIILHETKNGERRVIPLAGYAHQIMKAHYKKRDKKCEYVFPSQSKCQPIDIRTAWENALINAKITDFRFHDLRHSAASYLAMNGATLAEIAEVLGHKTLQMVKRYAHLSEAHTHKVVASMNDKIFGEAK
ncbi:MAG: integrase [Micavibrio sp.]|nr:integrase [Micavibrio sp.]